MLALRPVTRRSYLLGDDWKRRPRGCASSAEQSLIKSEDSGINGARHGHLRELRIQHAGRPYRILYAFDPRRCALLLIGGDKTGQDRWYEVNVPLADQLYDEHLDTLRKEGHYDG